MKSIKTALTVVALAAGLAACGGGGGDSGTPVFGGGSGNNGGNTGGGGSTPVGSASVKVTLSATTVTGANPVTVSAKVVDANNNPIPGVVVAFTTGNLGSLSAPSALTDASGVASVTLSPSSSASSGASNVVASADVDGKQVTAQAGYQLTATSVAFSSFTSDLDGTGRSLSAYGQAVLNVGMTGVTESTPVTLTFTSACVSQGKASISPTTLTSTSGNATLTYKDNGCGALRTTDTLTASVAGSTQQRQMSLPLTAPTANNLTFVSATPEIIYLKGSGYGESSTVTFKVVDTSGNALPNQVVTMNLSTFAGGLTLAGATSAITRTTDSRGEVSAIINSGTVPTPVRVTASLGNGATTVSNNLAVAIGLPSQLNFSLSQGTINIEGWNHDGTTNTYTIRAADRSGNPVPDGTTINFWTEGGQVHQTAQTVVSGGIAKATANFESASPRPADGRITVLAYALGEESFVDLNGNNVFDAGEPFQDLGDIVKDKLSDNVFDSLNDEFFTLDGTAAGSSACVDVSDNYKQFTLSSAVPSRPGTCSGSWTQRGNLRRATETVLSTSSARLLWGNLGGGTGGVPASSCTPITLQDTGPYLNSISGWNNYKMAAGDTWYGGKIGTLSFIVADTNTYPAGYVGRVTTGVNGSGTPILNANTAVTAVTARDSTSAVTTAGAGVCHAHGPSGSTACSPLLGRLNPVAAGSTLSVSTTSGLSAKVTGGSPVPSTSEATGATILYEFDDKTTSGLITVSVTSPRGLVTSHTVGVQLAARPGALCQ